MDTAKILQSGRSQAAQLPKTNRLEGREVAISRFGNGVLLTAIKSPWQTMRDALDEFEPGFQLEREQSE